MIDKSEPIPRNLDEVSDEVIMDLQFTVRDYLDRTYNSSQRLLELSFAAQGPDGKPYFSLDNQTAMREVQAHIALTHDPLNLETGSVAAANIMGSISVWHLAQRYMMLQRQENPSESDHDDADADIPGETSP